MIFDYYISWPYYNECVCVWFYLVVTLVVLIFGCVFPRHIAINVFFVFPFLDDMGSYDI